MSASGCSSSGWPTPYAFVSNDGEQPETFFARRERVKATGVNGNGMGVPLAMAVKFWPTPNASDGEKAPNCFSRGPTNPSLPSLAKTWATPRASDGEKGGANQSFGAGGVPLAAQTAQWPTPTSLSFGESHQPGNSRSYNKTMDLAAGLDTSFRQAQATSMDGPNTSPGGRMLNPQFVEALMGWPPGWTAFECSETALSRWKARMRSALSRLASPPAAPPAQLALFA